MARIVLEIPDDLERSLSGQASKNGVSRNRYIYNHLESLTRDVHHELFQEHLHQILKTCGAARNRSPEFDGWINAIGLGGEKVDVSGLLNSLIETFDIIQERHEEYKAIKKDLLQKVQDIKFANDLEIAANAAQKAIQMSKLKQS